MNMLQGGYKPNEARTEASEVFVFKKIKFFYFSDRSLYYQEVKFFKTKTLLSVVGLGIVLFVTFFLGNYLIGDPLGVTRKADLVTENKVLKDEIKQLTQKAARVQMSIDDLVERNNQLRLMVDLGKIDTDTRKAAVGGSLSNTEFAFLSRDASTLLESSHDILSHLEREVELQKKSYLEINKQYESNKAMFKHLPAIKPCDGPYSINGFGMRIHPVLGVWRMHEGIDILNEEGTPVYAPGDAVVHFAGRTQSGYGRVIELDHGFGYTTLYAHLSSVLVRNGAKVKRGELIAKVGRSGLVSGPHLHYEIRLNGRKQNPVDYFFDDVNAARYRAQLASTQ